MKHLVLTKILGVVLVLTAALPAFAQFPNLSGKLVQGKQTTALGITSYSDTVPLHTPTAASWRNNTQIHRDTSLGVDYVWRYPRWYANSTVRQSSPPPATRAAGSNFVDYTETLWQNSTDSLTYYYEEKQQCWQPVGTVVRDTTPVSTAATGTSAAVCYEYSLWYNSTNDSLYAYTAGAWLAIGSGGGGTAGAVDSIVVLQDSIIVGYSEGVEVTRDTVGFPGTDIADIPGLTDSLSSHPSGTGTNLRIPVWTGTASLGSSTLLQSATGQTLDANLAFRITGGTTASRPTGAAGMMYWNTSNTNLDIHVGSAWNNYLYSNTASGAGTAGRVFYAASNGTAAADDLLYWNSTINGLGIGATPTAALHISSPSGGQNTGILLQQVANNAAPQLSYASIDFQVPTTGLIGQFLSTASNYSASGVNLAGNSVGLTSLSNQLWFAAGAASGFINFNVGGYGTSTERMRITSAGLVGIGTASPDRLLHSELSGSATTTAGYPGRFSHITSGTAGAGFGTRIELEAENASGTNRIIGDFGSVYTTATNAAEVSDFVISTMRAGTLTESLRSLGNGTLQVGTLSGTATQWLGATAGNILTTITPGYGLSLASGGVRVDTTALKAQFLPLTLTGTTTVNTAGQTLRIRDAGGYPDVFMNSNYWVAASDVNTFFDAGSTTGQIQINSAGRTIIAAATNLELQSGITGEMRFDGDSLVLEGVYPVGTASDSVLVRDASNNQVKLVAQSDMEGVWLKTVLESGNNVDVLAVDQSAFEISDLAGFNILNATDINLEGGNIIELTTNNFTLVGNYPVGSSADSVLVQDASTGRVNIIPQVSEGAGIDISSGLVISTTQSFFNDYDASITLTGITATPDTIDADSNVKSNDWGFNPTTNTYTYNGVSGRYYSVSLSAQARSSSGAELYLDVYRNGTITSAKAQAVVGGSTEPVALHGQAILLLTNGDTINAKASCSGGTEDFDIENYSLIIKEI